MRPHSCLPDDEARALTAEIQRSNPSESAGHAPVRAAAGAHLGAPALAGLLVVTIALLSLVACRGPRPTPEVGPESPKAARDSGVLEVEAGHQPWSQETFSIERVGSGGWLATAVVTPRQAGQGSREVRLELDARFRPMYYSEETRGGNNPLSLEIRFESGQARVSARQGTGEAQSRILPGDVELFLGDQLWHHAALHVRAFLLRQGGPEGGGGSQASGTESSPPFSLFGGLRLVVEELEPVTLEDGGGRLDLRHFRIDVGQGRMVEHVWMMRSGLRLVKVEVPGKLTATRADVASARSLRARDRSGDGIPSAVPLRGRP